VGPPATPPWHLFKQIITSIGYCLFKPKKLNMNDVAVTTTQPELFIKMAVAAWDAQCARVNKLIDELTDEQLMAEVAPGRNTGIYLFGHLIAATDAMLPLLGLGEKLYPELTEPFLTSADKAGHKMPPVSELRKYWKEVNTKFSNCIASTSTSAWFMKHTAVSEEDFVKEPHRNKLNVLLSRTSHHSYHLGQLVFLKKK